MWYLFEGQSIVIIGVIILVAVFASVRVVLETRSPSKTAAYLLLIILLPIMGSVIYFLVGVNYRKRRIYSKKLIRNEHLFQQIRARIVESSEFIKRKYQPVVGPYDDLVELQLRESIAALTVNNVSLLINGENKFPSVIEDLRNAKSFIHLEYYIVEDDSIGNQIKDILIEKAKEGVTIRFIYDDFGSREIRNRIAPELRKHGIQIHPFYRIYLPLFANRINYRDHRKVIIIDGCIGYIGGINLSERYVNREGKTPYWRDTHLRLEGSAVLSLQYHFLSNWNFCADDNLDFRPSLFPLSELDAKGNDLVQIVTSGPDYPRPSIMMSYFMAIMAARKSVYISSPYFIPNESIFNAIKTAALSGKDVRLLMPSRSDSSFVNAASHFYIQELLESGVHVYFYQKGFVHSKTMVVDNMLSIVGTANMDLRSFELNFEINAVVYSEEIGRQLTEVFQKDLEESRLITLAEWNQRSNWSRFLDGVARILAPLL